ncbi:MAG: trypsin-like peptidase domain-containing protein [Candidatus Dadabacteria bacterium]|nr:trypsin-like peptidase domain-containing protein [Candidatus Dadabacteria bacterium]
MFVDAIEKAAEFTRPIHIVRRNFGSTEIIPSTATLFFVNDEGWALTCGHVTDGLLYIQKKEQHYQNFKTEIAKITEHNKKKIEKQIQKKYGYDKPTTVQLKCRFMQCIEGNFEFIIERHEQYDIALIKFNNFTRLRCSSFPVFPADTTGLKPGRMLCRLGYPFPEYTNFTYNATTDDIEWTQSGQLYTPAFPIEGMLTRYLDDGNKKIFGFELSTPGLRGQSGGPAFDADCKVWGMQSETNHLDLDFDIERNVVRGATKKIVKDSSFLHVGHCVHVDIIKAFMRDKGVNFIEK